MKFSIVAAVGLGLATLSTLAVGQDKDTAKGAATAPPANAGAGAAQFKDLKARASYALGLLMARNLKAQSVEIDQDVFVQGIRDALAGDKSLLNDQQIQETMQAFQQQLMAQRQEATKNAAEKNKAQGAAFLAENKKKPGVVTLPSGLQYKVIKEGTGPSPKATDTVKTNYRGTLLDGTEFDSSYKRGQPATFGVNQVIPGWTEALQKMKVGSKWQLFIPSELAYGENPRPGGPIGPNAVLVFDIELLGIE